MISAKNIKYIAVIIGILIICGSITLYEYKQGKLKDAWTSTHHLEQYKQKKNTPSPQITIHIAGAVQNPGVYNVSAGLRVMECLEKAGGLLKNAELDKVNLASKLKDGKRIYIPTKKEKRKKRKSYSSKNIVETKQSLNLNTATKQQLQTIQGIGPITAQKIITYRIQNGPFKTLNELIQINGISQKKIQKMMHKHLLAL